MDKTEWKDQIKLQTQAAGMYRAEFQPAIDALAEILEQRDKVYQQYLDEGSRAVVVHVQDRGAANTKKNPLLQVWMDLNAQALAYWRDLGLTPSGLKKINEKAMEKPKRSALAEAMKALNG